MAPLSLKIILDQGAVTRTILFQSTDTVSQAYQVIKEKLPAGGDYKDYGLFLRSADNPDSGIWLKSYLPLENFMLRDGDSLEYLSRTRNLRVRMLDGAIKTLQVDETKNVGDLMMMICNRIGLANYEEYGLVIEEKEEPKEGKEKPSYGTLTLRRKQKERDAKMEELSKKLRTDDNVIWLDQHKTLREMGVEPNATLLLKRRLFYSDRNIDSRDPMQLNLLYVQIRDAILMGTHPVTEDQASECKVRWINIRDVHRRLVRKAANTGKKSRPYKYEKQMAFIRPFYRDFVPLPMASDSDHDNDNETNTKSEPDLDHPDDDHSHYESEGHEVEVEVPVKKRKKRATKRKIEDLAEMNNPETIYTEPILLPESDPVDAFLLTIGTTLKTFSPYHLNLAKTKIFGIVQEHDLQQIMERDQSEAQSSDVKVSMSSGDPMYES